MTLQMKKEIFITWQNVFLNFNIFYLKSFQDQLILGYRVLDQFNIEIMAHFFQITKENQEAHYNIWLTCLYCLYLFWRLTVELWHVFLSTCICWFIKKHRSLFYGFVMDLQQLENNQFAKDLIKCQIISWLNVLIDS